MNILLIILAKRAFRGVARVTSLGEGKTGVAKSLGEDHKECGALMVTSELTKGKAL